MQKKDVRLGTRKSPLALWQAHRIRDRLAEVSPGVHVEIVEITTTGDKILDKPLVQVGGKGIFTKEIEDALLDERIDFAVHSYKDLPTVLPDGLSIGCVPERDSPFDALFSRKATGLADMPEAPVIATGSLRRRAQILIARPKATVVDLRGNVQTRRKKFEASEWDGMIMAHAAIRRMRWDDAIAGPIAPEEMLPAPAQGALAIEARSDDEETRALLERIHSQETSYGVVAERAFLARLEGGCQVPIAAYAEVDDNTLTLHGLLSSLEGDPHLRLQITGSVEEAETLGNALAERMLEQGGAEIIDSLKQANETES